jgi:hypothetical protein
VQLPHGGPPAAQIISRSVARTGAVKSFHALVPSENVPPRGIGLTHLEGDLAAAGSLARGQRHVNGAPLRSKVIIAGSAVYFKSVQRRVARFSLGTTNPVASFFDPAKGVWAVIKGATDAASLLSRL